MEEFEIFPGAKITSDKCLLLKEGGMMVVADLHIGYESALEQDGIHIPRIQTVVIRDSLIEMVERYEPQSLVVLGDIKHEFSKNAAQEMSDVRELLRALTPKVEVTLIKGNHDNFLENIASRSGVKVVDIMKEDGIMFAHGHANCFDRPLVIGHEHPSIKIIDTVGAYLKLPCFMHLEDEGILVLPAFSPLASGTDAYERGQVGFPFTDAKGRTGPGG